MSQADKDAIASMARDWNRDHDELQARIAELEAEVEELRAKVTTADRMYKRRLAEVERLSRKAADLWAPGDICAHYAISRTTLKRWRTWPDFPEPHWRVSRGTTDVWDAAVVREWVARAQQDGRVKP